MKQSNISTEELKKLTDIINMEDRIRIKSGEDGCNEKRWEALDKLTPLAIDLANEVIELREQKDELFQMVKDLKNCIKRLSQDNVTQFDRDKEAQWEGEAHELLVRINPNYYRNANSY